MSILSQTDLRLTRPQNLPELGNVCSRNPSTPLEILLECELSTNGDHSEIKASLCKSLKINNGESFDWFGYKDRELRIQMCDAGLKGNFSLYARALEREYSLADGMNTNWEEIKAELLIDAPLTRILAVFMLSDVASQKPTLSDHELESMSPQQKLFEYLSQGAALFKATYPDEFMRSLHTSPGVFVSHMLSHLNFEFLNPSCLTTYENIITALKKLGGESLYEVISAAVDEKNKKTPGAEPLLESLIENSERQVVLHTRLLEKVILSDPDFVIKKVLLPLKSEDEKINFLKCYTKLLFNESERNLEKFFRIQSALISNEQGISTKNILSSIISGSSNDETLPDNVLSICVEIVTLSAQSYDDPVSQFIEVVNSLYDDIDQESGTPELAHALSILEHLLKHQSIDESLRHRIECFKRLNQTLTDCVLTSKPYTVNLQDIRDHIANSQRIGFFLSLSRHSVSCAKLIAESTNFMLLDDAISASEGSELSDELKKLQKYLRAAHTSIDSWLVLRFGDELRSIIGLTIENPNVFEKSLHIQLKRWSEKDLLNTAMLHEAIKVVDECVTHSLFDHAARIFKVYKEYFAFKHGIKDSIIIWDNQEAIMNRLPEADKKDFCELL